MIEEVIEYNNEKHTLKEWSDIFGISYTLLEARIKAGKSLEEALFSSEKRERIITYQNQSYNLRQWSEILKIPYYCLRSRLNTLHWTVEKAFSTPYGGSQDDK